MKAIKRKLKKIIIPKNGHKKIVLNYRKLKNAILILRAIKHPVRQDILGLIGREKKITSINIYMKLRLQSASATSQHITILRRLGFITRHKNGKIVLYALNKDRIALIAETIEKLYLPGL